MKRRILLVVSILLVFIGLAMLIAPRVSNQVGKQIAHSTIEDFKSLKSEATADEITDEKRSEQSEINQEHQGSQKSSETVLGENRENIPKIIKPDLRRLKHPRLMSCPIRSILLRLRQKKMARLLMC